MDTIQFPVDFTIFENRAMGSVNYIHQRIDGSVISVLHSIDSEYYEVWDEKYMQYPETMDHYELVNYLSSTVSQLLTYQFFLNEDLILN